MKNSALMIVASSVLFLLPLVGSADPWKDESGNYGGHHEREYRDEHDDDERKHKDKDRHKRKHEHEREGARTVQVDIGIGRGTCDRDAIGAILGGVVGGVVGSEVGKNNGDQTVGILVGTIAGVIIGHQIGKDMDEGDRQCTVQALEQAKTGQTIHWNNPDNGLEYRLTPGETYQKEDLMCRKYVAVISSGEKNEKINREACRQSSGHWDVRE